MGTLIYCLNTRFEVCRCLQCFLVSGISMAVDLNVDGRYLLIASVAEVWKDELSVKAERNPSSDGLQPTKSSQSRLITELPG